MCQDCKSFKQFYTEEESSLLLEDIGVAVLLSNTEDTPRFRGETQVKMIKNYIIDIEEGNIKGERLEFSVKADPSYEPEPQKIKKGFVEYYYKNKKLVIHRVYCTCLYFATRCFYALVKGNNATWDIDKKYIDIESKRNGIKVHNRKPAKKMNPSNVQMICKHIFYLLNDENYIPWTSDENSEIVKKPVKKTLPPKVEPVKKELKPVKPIEPVKKTLPPKVEPVKKDLKPVLQKK